MNTPLFRLMACLALVATGLGRVSAQTVVNVDFDYQTNGSQTYSGQGAYSDPGHDYWNSINTTNINSSPALTASDGVTVTGITFTLFDFDPGPVSLSGGGSTGPVASDLMRDYLYTFQPSATPILFSIGGLTPGSTYDIYIYSAVGGYNWTRDRQAVFTLDGLDQAVNGFSSATDGGPLYTTFVLGVNYLKFTVTPTGTTIEGNFYTPTDGGEAEFNGLQIVETATAVPEPATWAALAGAMALGVTALRRRRAR